MSISEGVLKEGSQHHFQLREDSAPGYFFGQHDPPSAEPSSNLESELSQRSLGAPDQTLGLNCEQERDGPSGMVG